MNNKKIIDNYTKNKPSLKVRQLDKNTGKVINVFKNRYQAATWILENGLTNYFYDTVGKTRSCIAGALTNSLLQDCATIYGYRWEVLPASSKAKVTYSPIKLKTGAGTNIGRRVIVEGKGGKTKMPSMKAAAALLSVKTDKLNYHLNKYGKLSLEDGTTIMKQRKTASGQYSKALSILNQEIPVVAKNILTNEMVKFPSMTKASSVFSVHRDTIKNSIKNRKPHKDIQWKLLVK